MFMKEINSKANALLYTSYGLFFKLCDCILYPRAHVSQGWCLRVVNPHSRGRVHRNDGSLSRGDARYTK